MTDARLPERWLLDRRLNRASDAAHRTFINVLLYAVSNRTDGVVDRADLELIPRARSECVPELERLGLVKVHGDRLILVDWAATQTSRRELEVLENARRRDREKKARQRATRRDADDAEEGPRDSPGGTSRGTVPGDSTGKARQGKARTGTYGTDEGSDADDASGATVVPWPDVTSPGSGSAPPAADEAPDDLVSTFAAADLGGDEGRARALAAVAARQAERARKRLADLPRTEYVPGQQALPGLTYGEENR